MGVKRGAAINPGNPFERFHVEEDPAAVEELRRIDPEWEPPAPKTAFFVDDTQTLITKNESPDLSFDASLNPYRGCENGCTWCVRQMDRTSSFRITGAKFYHRAQSYLAWLS